MQEKISHFLERGVRREIFYRIPSENQMPAFSIDVA
jgi:hypothetical protein